MIRHGSTVALNGRVLTIPCPACRVRDDHEPGDDRCRTMLAERDLKDRS